ILHPLRLRRHRIAGADHHHQVGPTRRGIITIQPMLRSLAVLFLCSFTFAQGTKTWDQNSFDDFEKGSAQGVAIRSDGASELAPDFAPLVTTPSSFIWSIASDSAGNIYAGTGAPARVYRIAVDGKIDVLFEPKELQVQSVVVADDGAVYAATSPDGK